MYIYYLWQTKEFETRSRILLTPERWFKRTHSPIPQRTQCKAATWYCPRGSNRPFASHPNSMTTNTWSHFSTLSNLICDLQPFPILNVFNLYLEQFKWKNMEKPIVRRWLRTKNTSIIVSHYHSLALQHQEMHWSTLLEFSSFVPSCITSRHTMWQGKSAVPWRSPPTCLVTIRSQAWMHWCGLLHKIFRPRMVQNKRVCGWWGWRGLKWDDKNKWHRENQSV